MALIEASGGQKHCRGALFYRYLGKPTVTTTPMFSFLLLLVVPLAPPPADVPTTTGAATYLSVSWSAAVLEPTARQQHAVDFARFDLARQQLEVIEQGTTRLYPAYLLAGFTLFDGQQVAHRFVRVRLGSQFVFMEAVGEDLLLHRYFALRGTHAPFHVPLDGVDRLERDVQFYRTDRAGRPQRVPLRRRALLRTLAPFRTEVAAYAARHQLSYHRPAHAARMVLFYEALVNARQPSRSVAGILHERASSEDE